MRNVSLMRLCEFFNIWGMVDKQTLISSKSSSDSFFLHLRVARIEKLNSHKYDVENCSKIFKAFLAIETYSSIEIQN